jgi:thiol-disulfide isomerase/thioredoxin
MRSLGPLLGLALCAAIGCRPSADLAAPDEPDDAPQTPSVTNEPADPTGEIEQGLPPDDPEPSSAAENETDAQTPEDEPVASTEPTPAPAEKPKPKPAPPALPKPHYTKVDATCGNDGGVGQRLKGFKLSTTDGKSVSSGNLRGRVAVVNFWGTWCKPCLKELPEFDHLVRRYRKHGVTLVAIATDSDPVPVDEFVNKRKLAAKVLIGGEAYANEYGSPKFPFTFVVDHTGVIRGSYRGYRPECMGKLEADIRAQVENRDR